MADVPAWLVAARARADQPPREPREPLHVDGAVVGSVEPALAQRWVEAGLPVRRTDAGWHVEGSVHAGSSTETGADAAFAVLARWLHDAGLAGRWRDERLAVTDAGGRVLGAVERSVVRAFGITTFAVHLIGSADDGRVWVQKRALDKATDPGLWDTTMGGQVAAGEAVETSLARETMEEAGLDVAALLDLQPAPRITFRRPVEEGWLVEHIDVFTATLPAGAEPVNRDGEVERFECLDRTALVARLAAAEFTLEATLILAAWLQRRSGAPAG